MTSEFDAIVIGTGQSGPSLAAELAHHKMRVAVIERQDFGGSCVNFGCIPTKAYVASALAAHYARAGADYGVNVGEFSIDLKQVKARKDRLVEESSTGVEKNLRDDDRITVIHGHARFVGPRDIRVDDSTFTAGQVFINVGARANVPDIPGLKKVVYLSSTDMLELENVPDHLAIIGGGYVGVEFAQMFRRFGARVTVIQHGDRLLEHEDDDVSDGVRKILEAEGVNVLTNTEPKHIREAGIGVSIELEHGKPIVASHLLVAAGRKPNTDMLGTKEAGLDLDDHGYIHVDQHLRTNVEGVFAMGDCNGRGAFTHTSFNDFQIVRDHLFGDGKRSLADRIDAHAVYIDPPLARIGITERQARQRKGVLMAKMGMSKVGRAKEMGETHGFMKVLVNEANGQILGASILGLHGDEAIHCLLDVMYAKRPYTVVRDAVHIHPTVSELLPTLLEQLNPL